MDFPAPLTRGRLVRRYKRFLADVILEDGTAVTAHVPNSGSMMGLLTPDAPVWLAHHEDPKRKLAWTWELVADGDTLVGLNTHRANALAAEAVGAGLLPALTGYDRVRREVRYGRNSRIDLLLESDAPATPPCHVEVKNVTLWRENRLQFPDATTGRGTKHLAEMSTVVAEGGRAVMLYLAQRDDADAFSLAADIDPTYGDAAAAAAAVGVEFLACACQVTPEGITVHRLLPLATPLVDRTRRAVVA